MAAALIEFTKENDSDPFSEFCGEKVRDVRVRFPALPNFLRSSGSGTGSTQPRVEK
jgi:hypothetical protein